MRIVVGLFFLDDVLIDVGVSPNHYRNHLGVSTLFRYLFLRLFMAASTPITRDSPAQSQKREPNKERPGNTAVGYRRFLKLPTRLR